MQDIKLKATQVSTRQTNQPKLTDTDNSMVDPRGKGGEGTEGGKGVKCMVTGKDLTLGGGHAIQYTDDVL